MGNWAYEIWFDDECVYNQKGYNTETQAKQMAEIEISEMMADEDFSGTKRKDYEIRTMMEEE